MHAYWASRLAARLAAPLGAPLTDLRAPLVYRLLRFAHGTHSAVVAHGLTKEPEVPARDIERAIERRRTYEQDPAQHRATFDL